MRFWLKGLTAVLVIALSGCAGMLPDSTINLKCPALERHMREIHFDLQPDGSLASTIGTGAVAHAEAAPIGNAETSAVPTGEGAANRNDDPLSRAMTDAMDRWGTRRMFENDNGKPQPLPAILILSGGGQWGAFGAGFLRSLSRSDDANQNAHIATSISSDDNAIRNATIVTGISTGAIQALFVLADDYEGLYDAYTAHEASEYARTYSGALQPLINGSRYSIRPLLDLLRARLMGTDGKASMLNVIANRLHHRTNDMRGPNVAFVGMVNARTGHFVEVNLSELISDIVPDGEQPSAEDADCVAAVVLASSAIPVNFEPVAISYGPEGSAKRDVFYDGGVRQSVFFDHITDRSTALMRRLNEEITSRNNALMESFQHPSTGTAAARREAFEQPFPDSLPFYVIRNGPSTVRPSDTINDHPDIISAADRGYAIIVNQSEVMAVCSLRLGNPSGQIMVQTADRYQEVEDIKNGPPPRSAFDTIFMRALAVLGEAVGNGASGPRWLTLQPIGGETQNKACVLRYNDPVISPPGPRQSAVG